MGIFAVIHIIISALLILIVMMQGSKSEGLSGLSAGAAVLFLVRELLLSLRKSQRFSVYSLCLAQFLLQLFYLVNLLL